MRTRDPDADQRQRVALPLFRDAKPRLSPAWWLWMAVMISTGLSCGPVVDTGPADPTPDPTADPTPDPTPEPTPDPTPEPTPEPTPDPGPEDCSLDGDEDLDGLADCADVDCATDAACTAEAAGWSDRFDSLDPDFFARLTPYDGGDGIYLIARRGTIVRSAASESGRPGAWHGREFTPNVFLMGAAWDGTRLVAAGSLGPPADNHQALFVAQWIGGDVTQAPDMQAQFDLIGEDGALESSLVAAVASSDEGIAMVGYSGDTFNTGGYLAAVGGGAVLLNETDEGTLVDVVSTATGFVGVGSVVRNGSTSGVAIWTDTTGIAQSAVEVSATYGASFRIVEVFQDGVLIAGTIENTPALYRFDASGSLVWSRILYRETLSGVGNSVLEVFADGDEIVVACLYPGSASQRHGLAALRLDAAGFLVSVIEYPDAISSNMFTYTVPAFRWNGILTLAAEDYEPLTDSGTVWALEPSDEACVVSSSVPLETWVNQSSWYDVLPFDQYGVGTLVEAVSSETSSPMTVPATPGCPP